MNAGDDRCACGKPMHRVVVVRWTDTSKPVGMISVCQDHLALVKQRNAPSSGILGIEVWDKFNARRYAAMAAKGQQIEHFADIVARNPLPGGKYRGG